MCGIQNDLSPHILRHILSRNGFKGRRKPRRVIYRDFPFQVAIERLSSVIALGAVIISSYHTAVKTPARSPGRLERPCPNLRHSESFSPEPPANS